MTLKQIFGRNVKYYRFMQGYTQEEFAEYAKLTPSYISELENGKYGPTYEKVEDIAKILKVEPYQLFQKNDKVDALPARVDMIQKEK